jgi:hypothetical protein
MSKIDGKRLNNPLLNYFMEQELASFPKEYLSKVFNDAYPKIGCTEGKITVYGTSGAIDNNDYFLDLFKSNKNEE